LFFDGQRSEFKGTTGYCDGGYGDDDEWTVSQNTVVKARIDYNKIPMANNLKAKISKTLWRGGVHIEVGGGDNYLHSSSLSYYQNKSVCRSADSYSDGGTGSSYSVHLYGPSSKRLKAYSVYARYTSTDNYVQPEEVRVEFLYLACRPQDLTCD